jgi:hypothetical protein
MMECSSQQRENTDGLKLLSNKYLQVVRHAMNTENNHTHFQQKCKHTQ